MRQVGTGNNIAQCPLCSFSTKLLSSFSDHLTVAHDTTPRDLWDRINGGPGLCGCGCGGVTTWRGWHKGYSQYLKGHWRRGRTKHNDPSVARGAAKIRAQFDSGGRTPWSKGLTKETDPRVAKRAEATSRGLKRAYEDGSLKSWSKGHTVDTHPSLRKTSGTLKQAYAKGRKTAWYQGRTRDTCPQLDAATRKHQLPIDEVVSRIEGTGMYTLLTDLDEQVYRNVHSRVDVSCNSCNLVLTGEKIHKFFPPAMPCPSCSPVGSSQGEREVADFIEHELGLPVVRNDRVTIFPYELDVYVPSRQFALEYNGLYWHSGDRCSKSSHMHKTKLCTRRGIRLLHVFSDEWASRRDVVKSLIRAKLDVGMRRLDARKCDVREVQLTERREFFNTNHLEGDTGGKFALGLYWRGELVQCMSFRVPRQQKYRDARILENARTCPTMNTYIRGGLSRLTHRGLERANSLGYSGLMTYVDERLGGDHAYGHAGWQFVDRTKAPSFWWTDYVVRLGRLQFRADRARGMSEREVACEAGVERIYGCLNKIYTVM